MKAELIFYRKNIEADGDIVEMRIWKVPSSKVERVRRGEL